MLGTSFGFGDGLSAVAAMLLIVLNVVGGCFYAYAFPMSFRMETSEDSTVQEGGYAHFYYAMGFAFIIFNIGTLIASFFPHPMVKRVGCALLLVGTALCSFVMIQVQAIVIVDARAYSDCSDAPISHQCRGDKANFIATCFFMFTNAFQLAYAVVWSIEGARKQPEKKCS